MNTPEKDLQIHIEQALEGHGIRSDGLLSLSIQTAIWQGIRKYVEETTANTLAIVQERTSEAAFIADNCYDDPA